MTDSELRDAGAAELRQTSTGWLKANGSLRYPNGPPPTTHWAKGLAQLAQISTTNAVSRDAAVADFKRTTAGYSAAGKWWKAGLAELAKITDPIAPGWTKVADEWGSFTLAAAGTVRYGKNTSWTQKSLAAGTYQCSSAVFGSDPAPGTPKECQVAGGVVPPLPPDPLPAGAKPLTGSITTGGTYTGAVSGDISISTTAPVVIDTFTLNNGTIHITNGADVTIRRGTINGRDGWDSPRWVYCAEWKRLIIENCSILNTTGIELSPNHNPNPITQIRFNYHKNPKGNAGSPVGNFVQMRVIWGGDKWASDGGKNPSPGEIEIAWNHIVNIHNESDPEDVFSIYKTARTRIHDNLIEGQTKPDALAGGGSSQNSITIDPADEPRLLYDNQILRNFVIDAYSIGMFGGDNNLFQDNYVISDGYMGDTGKRMQFGYSGMFIGTNGTGNKAIDNTVGYINGTAHGSQRVDFQQDGGEWTGNVHFPDPITRQTELDHIAEWKRRAAAAGVKVGA